MPIYPVYIIPLSICFARTRGGLPQCYTEVWLGEVREAPRWPFCLFPHAVFQLLRVGSAGGIDPCCRDVPASKGSWKYFHGVFVFDLQELERFLILHFVEFMAQLFTGKSERRISLLKHTS